MQGAASSSISSLCIPCTAHAWQQLQVQRDMRSNRRRCVALDQQNKRFQGASYVITAMLYLSTRSLSSAARAAFAASARRAASASCSFFLRSSDSALSGFRPSDTLTLRGVEHTQSVPCVLTIY